MIPHSSRSNSKDFRWLAGLSLLGLLLLAGRFNWSARPQPSIVGYVLSGFIFLLLITGTFAFARAQAWQLTRGFWLMLSAGTVLLNFPLHLLRVDRLYYYGSHPHSLARQPKFVPEWMGSAPAWSTTDSLFSVFLVVGAVLFFFRLRRARLNPPRPDETRPGPKFVFVIFVLIIVQTWLHYSGRSPYSYVPHFEKPPSEGYTSTLSLLPDDRGLTNADVDYFTRLEEFYLGASPDTPTLFIRRSFAFYISGNLSYFIGPYHAFIIINVLTWLATMLVFHRLIAAVAAPLVARYATLLLLVSPGFIMFVAQPMSYFVGYATITLMLFGVHRGLNAPRPQSVEAIYASGVIVGLSLLTTDLFVWLPSLVLFSIATRRSWLHGLSAAIIGVSIYASFIGMVFGPLKLPHDGLNDKQLFEAITGTLQQFHHPASNSFYLALTTFLGEYVRQLGHAFFFVPVLLAAAGILCSELEPKARRVAGAWFLPSLATFFVMHLGESYLGSLPRFTFVAYPAIYLLAGSFLAWCDRQGQFREWPLGRVTAYGLVAVCAVLDNIDSFGFLPHLYYYFYYSTGGHFS